MPIFVMSGLLSVTLALVFYTWGIWGARRAKTVKPMHVAFLWLGLVLDAGGTGLMAMQIGYYRMDIHGIIGTLAILLMLVSAVWATYAVAKKDEGAIAVYLKASVWVWAVWLLPYFYGFIANRRG
ncbi:MAG: TIGR03987 family protein [Coriobacteriaceae bacterium]|nr:TIGR03987 family protein [Coriobacteriaceae bacterium]